jgi:hypothetical protein
VREAKDGSELGVRWDGSAKRRPDSWGVRH